MQDIKYSDVHAQLQAAIPELNDRFEKESWVINHRRGPRQYLVIELVLNPLLRELLDSNHEPALLKRIFEFFERMATSSDPEVPNLLAVGVFERLVNQPARMSVAWRYMGNESKKLAREVARGLLREQNLPKSW